MRLSIHIDRPDARVRSEAIISAAVARSAYPLPGAEVRYWVGQGWQVMEQGYDLPDVYVCSIEVEAMGDTVLPIRCPQHDLYGFYVVAGSVSLSGADEQTVVLRTDAGHYRLSYLPAAAYTCHFAAGTHHIFYFVAKGTTLLREPSAELSEDIAPVKALKARLTAPAVSGGLSMAGMADGAIRRFLRYPGTTYLRRYLTIQVLTMTLLLHACDALRVQRAAGTVGLLLAGRMRMYIDEHIADGEAVDAASVARHFEVSYAYAKLIFRSHMGRPIGGYIRGCKLEQARRLLEAGESPARVARYVCWTYGHLNKAFKARYGVPPSSYFKIT